MIYLADSTNLYQNEEWYLVSDYLVMGRSAVDKCYNYNTK